MSLQSAERRDNEGDGEGADAAEAEAGVLPGHPGPDQGEGAGEDQRAQPVLRRGHQVGGGGSRQEGEDRADQEQKDH